MIVLQFPYYHILILCIALYCWYPSQHKSINQYSPSLSCPLISIVSLHTTILYSNFLLLGFGVGWQCLQGSESEAYHTSPSAARHQRRRRVGQPDQGHHRRRRCYSSHPQVSHWQEGGTSRKTVKFTEMTSNLTLMTSLTLFGHLWLYTLLILNTLLLTCNCNSNL